MTSKIIPTTTSWPLIKRIAQNYLLPRAKTIGLAMGLMAVASSMTAAQAYLLEPIINKIFVNKQAAYLLPIGLAVIGVFLVRGTTTWASNVLLSYIGQDVVATIQTQLFHKLIRQDMAYFQANNTGGLSSLLVSDVTLMRYAMSDTLTAFGKNVLTLFFLIGVMFYQDWRLSLIAFIVFPPAGFVVSKIGKRLRDVARSTQEQQGILNGLLYQSFQGIRQVKAFGAEKYEDLRIGDTLNRITKLSNKSARVASLSMPLSELLSGLAIALIVFYGGSQVIDGVSTPGKFFSFIGAFIMAYEPLKRLAKMNVGLQVGLAGATRVFAAMDAANTITDRPHAQILQVKQPLIQFENVSFHYPDGSPALHDVSFTVPAYKKTALVGPSGSGKSTCLQLILRFFDVSSGRILIDGTDIRDVTLETLRQALGFVSQDVFIFDDTIAKNIAYAQDHADPALIESAARKAAAHDFISVMEDGYQTRVGEMGTKLSGGQKQRVAIARAILKNAPLLLLDEATSALDTESEKWVTEALNTLENGRTSLVVAHRLSTIRDADQIILLEKGRVTATGTHESLMSQGGLYPTLYESFTV